MGQNKRKKSIGLSHWGKKLFSPHSPPFHTTRGICVLEKFCIFLTNNSSYMTNLAWLAHQKIKFQFFSIIGVQIFFLVLRDNHILDNCRVDNPFFGVAWVVFMGVPSSLV